MQLKSKSIQAFVRSLWFKIKIDISDRLSRPKSKQKYWAGSCRNLQILLESYNSLGYILNKLWGPKFLTYFSWKLLSPCIILLGIFEWTWSSVPLWLLRKQFIFSDQDLEKSHLSRIVSFDLITSFFSLKQTQTPY